MRKRKPNTFHKHLPSHLWAEILFKLPTTTTLRKLRLVCKSWYSIIHNPPLINNSDCKNYVLVFEERTPLHHGNNRAMFVPRCVENFNRIPNIINYNINMERFGTSYYQVRGSLNGLFLLFDDGPPMKMVLCNPLLRKSFVLPPCPLGVGSYESNRYGLGFSPSRSDYKVAVFRHIPFDQERFSIKIAVYEGVVGSWRIKIIDMDVPIPIWLPLSCGFGSRAIKSNWLFYSNGALHWVACDRREHGRLKDKGTHMVSFELDTEEFSSTEFPCDEGDIDLVRFPFLLGETLAIFEISCAHSFVWVMEKNGDKRSWTKWYSGDSNSNSYEFFRDGPISSLVYVEKSVGFLMGMQDNVWKSYDIKSRQIKHLGFYDYNHITYIDNYPQSLLLC